MSNNDNTVLRFEVASPIAAETTAPDSTRAGVTDLTPVEPAAVTETPLSSRQGSTDDTEELREEIEETRAEISETLNAIQEKLNPQVLMDQAKESVQEAAGHIIEQVKESVQEAAHDVVGHAKESMREATVGKVEHMVSNVSDTVQDVASNAGDTAKGAGSTIMETIKQNPVPAALTVAGLGWLFMHRAKGATSAPPTPSRTAASPPPVQAGYQTGQIQYDSRAGVGTATGSRSGNTAGQAAGQVGNTMSDAANTVGHTVGDAASQVGSTVGDAASGLGSVGNAALDTLKHNPVPAALAAASLGWLFMHRANGSSTVQTHYDQRTTVGDVAGSVGGAVGDVAGSVGGAVGDAASTVGNTVSGAAGAVGSTVGDVAGAVGSAVGDAAGAVAGAVGGTASGVGSAIGHLGEGTGEQAQNAGGWFQQMLHENPMTAGAMVAAVGAAVGLAVPETLREHQLMGAARDSLMNAAGESARSTVEKVEHVAQEAGQAVTQTAHDEGLVAAQ